MMFHVVLKEAEDGGLWPKYIPQHEELSVENTAFACSLSRISVDDFLEVL